MAITEIGAKRRWTGMSSVPGCLFLSARWSGQLERVGSMQEAVPDGVGEGWVVDVLAPLGWWQLPCDDDGARIAAVIE